MKSSSSRPRDLRLDDLVAVYSERETIAHRLGSLNALGFAAWIGVEGMVICFTLKTVVFLGPVRLHALRLRGLMDSRHRGELTGAPAGGDGLIAYAWRCVVLLLWGVPFPRVGTQVKVLKDPTPTAATYRKPAGSFTLEQQPSSRR
jgi:hypothetical protein